MYNDTAYVNTIIMPYRKHLVVIDDVAYICRVSFENDIRIFTQKTVIVIYDFSLVLTKMRTRSSLFIPQIGRFSGVVMKIDAIEKKRLAVIDLRREAD